jgi:hypothetical protein
VTQLRKIKIIDTVESIIEIRNAFKILIIRPDVKRPLGRYR